MMNQTNDADQSASGEKTPAAAEAVSPEDVLWEMAAVKRNAIGTKILSTQYGLSKDQVKEVLEQRLRAVSDNTDSKALKPRYDYATGGYLEFNEWLQGLLSQWHKLPDE